MLFVLLGLSCFIFSCECLNSKSKTPWLYYDTLDFIELESPKVKRIIICFSDDDDPDNQMPFVEISDPEKIKKALEALRNAERGFMPDLFCKMKIITEHKKFIVDFDWDSETSYGLHWESKQFKDLLRKWGLPEARPKAPWQYDITLDKFFMDDECLRIEKIIICTPDDDEPDDWTPLLEISGPEKIKKAVEALETARRGFMPAWSNRMKIITENKKFIMKFDCNDKIAYGTHWESKEFRDLLREWGFPEPKPSYSPQGHEKVPRKVWAWCRKP